MSSEGIKMKTLHKPVLFPCVISASVSLADLGGEHPHDIHKQDEVELRKREREKVALI